jgi:esterase/lipase
MQTTQKTPQGFVLTIHGLNLKPAKMLSLARDLGDMGFSVLNVELSGHRAETDWAKVSRKQWLSEIKAAYENLQSQAGPAPLFLVGYSLGALLAMDLMQQDSSVQFQKAILLSPPLEIHTVTRLIEILRLIPSLKIPSLTPKEYRFNDGTSMAAYKALFQSIKAVHKGDFQRLNIPTTVMMDRKDELVSFTKLKTLIRDRHLSQWKMVPVSNQASTLPKTYHHLMIDSASVGKAQWQLMLDTIQTSLKTNPYNGEENRC